MCDVGKEGRMTIEEKIKDVVVKYRNYDSLYMTKQILAIPDIKDGLKLLEMWRAGDLHPDQNYEWQCEMQHRKAMNEKGEP
jgi:hypothetical protein